MTALLTSCFAGFEEICRPDAPLADLTWYRLGGPARWLISPRDEAELAAVIQRCRAQGVPWRVLGRGANLLVRDEGVDAAVIRLSAPHWSAVDVSAPLVRAGGGADFTRLVRSTLDQGLLGLEALAGIPGMLGGIVRMNAGGRHGSIADFVESVRVLDPAGQVADRPRAALGFAYRHTELDGCIVLGATLRLSPGDPDAGLARYRAIWNEKYATQPAVSERSAGCIFKNPPGEAAGRLLDRAGLKGARAGGAEISSKHANFIVAGPGATARDVCELIERARARVRETTGIELAPEIEIW